MRKEKFIISTIILMVGGCLTKVLGMIIKIMMSRLMGPEGIGLYMLILPTFSLFIGLAQFGFPIAISKLVAEEEKNNKNLLFSLLPISFLINLIIIIFIIFFSPYLANHLLHEPRSYYALLSIGVVLPLTSLSGMLRSYFFGRQKMLPHVVSNVTEDIIRLILIVVGVPIFLKYGLEFAVAFVVLTNIISELTSILVLFFFLPKHFKITKQDLSFNRPYVKESLGISIPSTTGRLIGSIGYFLEPIILSSVLLSVGYSNTFFVREYGILSGYVLPLLLLPSFFTMAISQALLPIVSKAYSSNKITYTKSKIRQAIMICLFIGIPVTIFFELFPSLPLKFVYNTTEGIPYLRVLAPICLFQYIQAPLSSSLDAMGKSSVNMKATFMGMLLRTTLLFLTSFLKIGLWSLVIATSINVLFTTFYCIKKVRQLLQPKKDPKTL